MKKLIYISIALLVVIGIIVSIYYWVKSKNKIDNSVVVVQSGPPGISSPDAFTLVNDETVGTASAFNVSDDPNAKLN